MATIKLILYSSKTYSNGEHPVMLRITHKRQSKYISLNYTCRPEQWDEKKKRFNNKSPNYKTCNLALLNTFTRAVNILEDIKRLGKPFTFQFFKEKFINEGKPTTVYKFFDELINELSSDKTNTKAVYKQTKNALLKFRSTNDLMFPDITPAFLKKFEKFLFKQGCSGGGVHFYMRTLRAAINKATVEGFALKEHYPFKTQFNVGYSLKDLKSNAHPRALSESDIQKIKAFPEREYPELIGSVRLFLFSYYARGMNFIDMALLKWTDIYDAQITYNRSKTGKKMSIGISENLEKLLNHFRGHDSIYVFGLLNDLHKTDLQIKNRVRKTLKVHNRRLKEIGKILNIPVPLTSYVARHCYAMALKRNDVSIGVISEGLGHSDVKVTKAYLKKFENKRLNEADKCL